MIRIANVSRLFGRFRPTVGLRTCLATLALFSVTVWFFSPAKRSPLPPRGEVERVVVLNFHGADASPWLGHMRAELPPAMIDRLYASLREATLTNDLSPDPENLFLVVSLRVYRKTDSLHITILASRDHGTLIETYGDQTNDFSIFRMKADPETFDAQQAIGEAGEEVHRRSMTASN